MKILQVIPRLARGGAEKVVTDLLNYQNAMGVDVYLFCLEVPESNSKDRELNQNIKTFSLDTISNSKFKSYFLTYKWILKNKNTLQSFDVIHTHLTFGLFFGAIAKFHFLRNSQNYPSIIFTSHLVGMRVSKFKLLFHRLFALPYDKIVLMARDAYWEKVIARNNKYVLIQNGIQALKRVDRKQKNGIRIGTLSRLAPERTPEVFLEFFSEFSKISSKIEFVIGGDGPERNQLIKLASQLGISHNTLFLGAIEDVPKFYDEVDFYIALNVGVTTGIAGLEAISTGLPTIAIQLDDNYQTGAFDWIASFLSPLKAREFLSELINDQDILLNYKRMQELVFYENFTSDIMASKYLKLYESL